MVPHYDNYYIIGEENTENARMNASERQAGLGLLLCIGVGPRVGVGVLHEEV